jgi:hypothetical protein
MSAVFALDYLAVSWPVPCEVVVLYESAAPLHVGHEQLSQLAPIQCLGSFLGEDSQRAGQCGLSEQLSR